jgi:hypothetical protein
VAQTVAGHGLGSVIPIGDTAGLLAAIAALQAADPRATEEKARAVLRENYSRQVNCAKLTAMVEALSPARR